MVSSIIDTYSFIYLFNGFKHCYSAQIMLLLMILMIIPSKKLNRSIWPIYGALTGITTLDQSRPESNGKEGVIYISQTTKLGPHDKMQFNFIPRTRKH